LRMAVQKGTNMPVATAFATVARMDDIDSGIRAHKLLWIAHVASDGRPRRDF
jgi:hypothetical protein